MRKIFSYYLCGVMTAALLAIAMLNFYLQSVNLEKKMVENSLGKMDQVSRLIVANRKELENLIDSLNEDYLTRARAFSYIVAQNPAALRSQAELEKIKALLNVDELHVIDEKGILAYGTIPKYFGMDFRSTKQTAEFLQILRDPNFALAQKIQPNGAERKVFQYVGVARADRPGIVQIGLEPRRQMAAKERNELSYIFSRIPLDGDGDIWAVDAATNRVLAHSNGSGVGENITALGFSEDYRERYQNGAFLHSGGDRRFYLVRAYGDIVLGIGQSEASLYIGRQEQMILVCLYLLATFLAVIWAIRYLLNRQIVRGIYRIIADLESITRGNLDTTVKVENNPEFSRLSGKINLMVKNILDTTVKISHIIDLVEAPIGVYECKQDMNRVLATDRLRHILSLSQTDAFFLYQDKNRFLEYLEKCHRRYPAAEGEPGVFQIADAPEKWIRIRTVTDTAGTFGMVMDVTEEILDKKTLRTERDYDPLTALCNRRSFARAVAALLKAGDLGVAALVMLDLDAFKQINDRYGHAVGDVYLKTAAKFLSEIGGGTGECIAGRRSGDEFYLFLYRFAARSEITACLRAFYGRLLAEPFDFSPSERRPIRVSAGIAWLDETERDFDALLAVADQAMYRAKKDTAVNFCE